MDQSHYQQIAQEYGTPVYVLEQTELDRSLAEIIESFSDFPASVHIAYPYKTNSLKRLCDYMKLQGMWADVSSNLEMQMALTIGVEPKHIVFNSPFKSTDALVTAMRLGCKVNIDNMEEFERICAVAKTLGITEQKVGIRVSPLGGEHWDKFGFALGSEALAAIKHMTNTPGIRLVGLHAHRSSISQLDEYKDFITKIVQFASDVTRNGLFELEYVDLGSGFSVKYPEPLGITTWTVPTMKQYVEVLSVLWSKASLPKTSYLIVEPGKRLVTSSVNLLTSVVCVKDRPNKRICFLDIGHNLIPGVDGYRHPISQIKTIGSSKREERYDIHGCLCDSLDIIDTDVPLFSLEVGDILCISNVGGYDMTRSFFWQVPRAPVVWVDKKFNCELVRTREDINYLWQLSV